MRDTSQTPWSALFELSLISECLDHRILLYVLDLRAEMLARSSPEAALEHHVPQTPIGGLQDSVQC